MFGIIRWILNIRCKGCLIMVLNYGFHFQIGLRDWTGSLKPCFSLELLIRSSIKFWEVELIIGIITTIIKKYKREEDNWNIAC